VDDARQIDANAGMSAPKNAAKCLKGQKSQRIGAKNGDLAEDCNQKPLHQTIRPNTKAAGELFRPSLRQIIPPKIFKNSSATRHSDPEKSMQDMAPPVRK
jgi:hypothetical protein